jgi:hypothetical protein
MHKYKAHATQCTQLARLHTKQFNIYILFRLQSSAQFGHMGRTRNNYIRRMLYDRGGGGVILGSVLSGWAIHGSRVLQTETPRLQSPRWSTTTQWQLTMKLLKQEHIPPGLRSESVKSTGTRIPVKAESASGVETSRIESPS